MGSVTKPSPGIRAEPWCWGERIARDARPHGTDWTLTAAWKAGWRRGFMLACLWCWLAGVALFIVLAP